MVLCYHFIDKSNNQIRVFHNFALVVRLFPLCEFRVYLTPSFFEASVHILHRRNIYLESWGQIHKAPYGKTVPIFIKGTSDVQGKTLAINYNKTRKHYLRLCRLQIQFCVSLHKLF